VAGSCEYGDEPVGSGAIELIRQFYQHALQQKKSLSKQYLQYFHLEREYDYFKCQLLCRQYRKYGQ
jgi:hypothetical protein